MLISYSRSLNKYTTTLAHNLDNILQNSNGVYTTCRAFESKIFMFSHHLDRIKNGLLQSNILFSKSDEDIIRNIIKKNLNGFDRVTIIFDNSNIFASFANVSKINSTVSVKAIVGKRDNANVKSVKWVNQRKEYEKFINEDVNEVILTDKNGNCYEGLSSNFYAVVGDKIYTAPLAYVLPGTVQQLVIDLFPDRVVYQFPNINDIWDAAIISSTSRLVLGVDKLYFQDKVKELDKDNRVVRQVQEKLYEAVVSKSEVM
eukprot:NODE_23_length_38171_cov_0.318108.p15 type:complete len:258 gc:universal NODE_23_length_38171_cov_0.318108:25627-26400(+)